MSMQDPIFDDAPPIGNPTRRMRKTRRSGKSILRPVHSSGRPVVLQVLPRLVSGGVERGTLEMARALRTAGGTPIVASGGGPLVQELRRAGITHIELPLYSKNPFVILMNIFRLRKIVTLFDVDIIHARSRAPAWSAYAAARQTGCAFVTTVHAAYKFKGRLKRWYNSVMTKGDRVIVISQFIADYALRSYAPDHERMRLIPRGVDLAEFHPDRVGPARTQKLITAWGLPAGRPVIMMPGRISRWKGQRELIEAIARLGRQDIVVVMVGGSDGRDHYLAGLQELARDRGLEKIIHFAGRCDDMPAALMLADIVVSASYDPEGFGRVVVEAMAMAKPVIVADHGASPELVRPGENGWIVPPRDIDALTRTLADALNMTPTDRLRLGREGQNRVMADFTRDLMCQRTMAVYDELLTARLMMETADE